MEQTKEPTTEPIMEQITEEQTLPKPEAAPDNTAPPSEPQNPEETKKAHSKKGGWKRQLLRVLISLAVIALGIFVILFLVAKATQFESIGAMWQKMASELALMWQRIIS